jgi:uncharacterized protein
MASMSDSPQELQPEPAARPEPIAPWFHTVFLLVILALWATYSALRFNLPVSIMSHYATYTSSIIMQCLLAGSTIAGLYHRRRFITSVLGSFSAQNLSRDLAVGIATYIGALSFAGLVGLAIRGISSHLIHRTDVVRAMAPQSLPQLALWIVVSLSAGICEEFVFRGYLQQQLTRWLGSVYPAIGISSLIFGSLHFYQGPAGVLQVITLGLTYGVVAARRGTLRSVMIAHFLQDAITGTAIYMHYQK